MTSVRDWCTLSVPTEPSHHCLYPNLPLLVLSVLSLLPSLLPPPSESKSFSRYIYPLISQTHFPACYPSNITKLGTRPKWRTSLQRCVWRRHQTLRRRRYSFPLPRDGCYACPWWSGERCLLCYLWVPQKDVIRRPRDLARWLQGSGTAFECTGHHGRRWRCRYCHVVPRYPPWCKLFSFRFLCGHYFWYSFILFFYSADYQIPSPECAPGDIYWLHGLYPKAYRSRRRDRSVEGFRTCNGESCSCKRELRAWREDEKKEETDADTELS